MPPLGMAVYRMIGLLAGSICQSVNKGRLLTMNDAQITHMVNRFLAWKLPETFNPDGGVVFKRTHGEGTPYLGKYEPSGTNLLNADEAKAMVLHMLDGMPS